MQRAFYIFTALFCVFSITANAQHIGYVITTENDTINCNMVKPVSFGGIRYQVTDGDDFIKVTEDKIKEYQLTDDSAIYVNKVLSDNGIPSFVQREEFGKVSLYVLFVSGANYGSIYYVSKGNDTAYILKKASNSAWISGRQKGGKEKLISMFSDQPEVAAEFTAEKAFDIETIQGYIWLYNDNAKSGK